jgi:hypothetical protein
VCWGGASMHTPFASRVEPLRYTLRTAQPAAALVVISPGRIGVGGDPLCCGHTARCALSCFLLKMHPVPVELSWLVAPCVGSCQCRPTFSCRCPVSDPTWSLLLCDPVVAGQWRPRAGACCLLECVPIQDSPAPCRVTSLLQQCCLLSRACVCLFVCCRCLRAGGRMAM